MEFKLFSGTANPELGQEIAAELGVPLGHVLLKKFADGEIRVELLENLRRRIVVLVQSVCPPETNGALFELELMIDAARRAGAKEICAVTPYFGYARQDKRKGSRAPVSARIVADTLEMLGMSSIMVVEPHSDQLEGFFRRTYDALLPRAPMLAGILQDDEVSSARRSGKLIVAAPDVNGTARARAYSRTLKTRFVVVDKDRVKPNVSKPGMVIGKVGGCAVLIADDIIDTAGTLCGAAEELIKAGAGPIFAAGVHPVLSPPAVERLEGAPIRRVFVSNTIPLRDDAKGLGKIRVIRLDPFIAEGIKRMLSGGSVSELSAT